MEQTTLQKGEAKLLDLVLAMNALNDEIDSDYGKIAVYLKDGDGDNAKSVRYFVKKRAIMFEDGIERWKFVARKEN